MSIFDKFKVNPYISTYAGAPIGEFNQTAGTLQQRMLSNISKSNEIELAMDRLQASGVDEEFKRQKIAEYEKQIDEISEAPEYATQKVMALAQRSQMDEDFKLMEANAKQKAAIEAEMAEMDVTDPQRYKYQQLLDSYEQVDEDGKAGAAAGRKFGSINFYEEQVLGDLVDERVDGIQAMKSGFATIQDDGTIRTDKGEIITQERVMQSAMGVLSDEAVKRQVSDEVAFRMRDQLEGLSPQAKQQAIAAAMPQYFFDQYVQGAISKYARKDHMFDLKGGRKELAKGYSTSATGAPMYSYDSQAVVQNRLTDKVTDARSFLEEALAVEERMNTPSIEYASHTDVVADENYKAQLNTIYDEMIETTKGLSGQSKNVMRKLFSGPEGYQKLYDMQRQAGNGALRQLTPEEAESVDAFNPLGAMKMATVELEGGPQGYGLDAIYKDIKAAYADEFTEKQMANATKEIYRWSRGTWLGEDMSNLIKKGAGDVAIDSKYVTLPAELNKELNLDESAQTIFNQFIAGDLEGAVLQQDMDSGRMVPVTKDDMSTYDMGSMKVTGLNKTGAPGTIQISINEHADTGTGPQKTMLVNLNQFNTDLSAKMANQFKKESMNKGENQQLFSTLAFNFGEQELFTSAQKAVNDVGSSKEPIPIAGKEVQAQYATALGTSALYLMYDQPKGEYYVRKENGEIIGTVGNRKFNHKDHAISHMITKAGEALNPKPKGRQNKTIVPKT